MNRLQVFMYLLMRDVVVPGEVERLVRLAERTDGPVFSNLHVALYAKQLADRLTVAAPWPELPDLQERTSAL